MVQIEHTEQLLIKKLSIETQVLLRDTGVCTLRKSDLSELGEKLR